MALIHSPFGQASPGYVPKVVAFERADQQDCSRYVVRILAIDPGSKRIGLAISDELKMIAQPLEFVPAKPFTALVSRLDKMVTEREVELVLIGMPRNMDGSFGPAALRVQEFVETLKGVLSVPIKTWDERLTSAQANRLLIEGEVRRDKRKEKVDQMAAAILLQCYLDRLTE